MIEKYITEFVDISESIRKKTPKYVLENRMYIKPESLRKMLSKKPFAETNEKMSVWRNLGWLHCDPDRHTKKVTYEGKQQRVCVINRLAAKQLAELMKLEHINE